MKARGIPDRNLVRVKLDGHKSVINSNETRRLLDEIRRQAGAQIKGWAIAWTKPYRAGCMSITSAVAMGYDEKYCASGCKVTSPSPWFNKKATPQDKQDFRPAMLLAGKSLQAQKALVDRGIAADFTRPTGTAYLLSTSDHERNVRAVNYPTVERIFANVLSVQVLRQDRLRKRNDVLFYFTGLKHVAGIKSLRFVPGAVADHLTSTGGVLFGGSQMSSLEWLDAGATGSYGTVVEPCNFPTKFSVPGVMMEHYMNGDTLLEAYWKSVIMPGQGLFIGEPLASPWNGCRIIRNKRGLISQLKNRRGLDNYVMYESKNCMMPWQMPLQGM